jgi:hypothetical protein
LFFVFFFFFKTEDGIGTRERRLELWCLLLRSQKVEVYFFFFFYFLLPFFVEEHGSFIHSLAHELAASPEATRGELS